MGEYIQQNQTTEEGGSKPSRRSGYLKSVSSGKAYVRGFDVKKPGTTVNLDAPKARTTETQARYWRTI